MQLMRLGARGEESPAIVDDDGIIRRLDGLTDDIDGSFLAADGVRRARDAAIRGVLPVWPGAEALRVGAPIAVPQAVICIGQNYAAHAAETGDPPPRQPIIFFKHPNTIVGPYDDVEIPPAASTADWEVELAVVIGTQAFRLATIEDARRVVAGLTISNDVSERTFQVQHSGGQWSKGKSLPTFNPLGPVLVPIDEVDDPQALRLWSRVNGEARQDSSTADMLFPVLEIVRHLSHYMRLEPGDVINTGTPQGVAMSGRFPYLRAGDVIELGIDGLGAQRQLCVSGGHGAATGPV